ncbi:MAG: hypothetical protein HWE22_03840 [Flavobacteriales bacterium]|nr:hypothetical protein [Flavobacteriales bacterium]
MKLFLLFAAISFGIIAFSSCKTSSKISESEGLMSADVGEGKVIYMRDCTRCHEEKKIENYTQAQWDNILPRMVIKAQLDDTQRRQVKAFVNWKLENN